MGHARDHVGEVERDLGPIVKEIKRQPQASVLRPPGSGHGPPPSVAYIFSRDTVATVPSSGIALPNASQNAANTLSGILANGAMCRPAAAAVTRSASATAEL